MASDNIRISPDIMREICAEISRVEALLQEHRSAVSSVLNRVNRAGGSDVRLSMNLRTNSSGSYSGDDVRSALNGCSKALSACARESVRITGAIGRAAQSFETTENRVKASFAAMGDGEVSGYMTVGNMIVRAQAPAKMTGSAEEKPKIDWQLDTLAKYLIASVGNVGKTVEAIWDIFCGDAWRGVGVLAVKGTEVVTEWKNIVHAFNKLKNFSKDYAAQQSANRAFGLRKYAKQEKISFAETGSWISRAVDDFGTMFKSGMKNAFSWATEILDKGIDNLNEVKTGHKDKGTAIAEWATETTLGVAAGAVSAALAAVILPASAPVIAIGAVGGLLAWGADTLWANTIGRGADEDGGNEGFAEQAGEAIVDFGKKLFNGVKGLFTNEKNISTAWS